MTANLYGVWAKWDRAVEQLQSLANEVATFGREPNAWGSIHQVDGERGKHVVRLYPRWEPGLVYLWGTIIGEIVHDLRSALDHLVWQLVVLNGGKPSRSHAFPVCRKEPPEGFAVATRHAGRNKDGRKRGPLFGLSDKAVALIETCQPYQGAQAGLLLSLHDLWATDKHQQLVPVTLVGSAPTIHVAGGHVIDRRERLEGEAYILQFSVVSDRPDPDVYVQAHAPRDILLGHGEQRPPVIGQLQAVAQWLLTDLLIPAADLFPGRAPRPRANPQRSRCHLPSRGG